VLLPCVGFNGQRMRLGYGGGFYDRTLAAVPRPLALGVAYSCARADFAGEAHDIALDAIFTEREAGDFGGEG
jgi:5,10-methenyltetrahydrofolate synthetase